MVKFLDFRLFITASYKSEVLQAKENSTEFPQTDGLLFNGEKEPVKVSGRNCSASSFGLVICSFYRCVQSFTTRTDAGKQIYLS